MQDRIAMKNAAPEKLTFEAYTLSALKRIISFLQSYPYRSSSMSAGYLLMWGKDADLRFCVWRDTFCVRQTLGEQVAFSYPFGADPEGMLVKLIEYAKAEDLPLRFFDVTEELLGKLRDHPLLQPVGFAYDRKWSDYLYEFEAVLEFRGKRFSGQRNHINKFRSLYGEPDLRPLDSRNLDEIESFLKNYRTQHADARPLERYEIRRAAALCKVLDQLHLYAAGLYVEDKLIAFSVGEIIGDTLMIHVEKAYSAYPGAYPTMYQGFVRLIRQTCGERLRYINREDDSGDMGLRTSKQQYHPIHMIDKYLVHAHAPGAKHIGMARINGDSVVLTAISEKDKSAYLELNLDTENNRYWGYDYTEDWSITSQIDEHTFYDAVLRDVASGDSINFAIRETGAGEMIGEAILWNFTENGYAELGLRLVPACQHKGLGRDAFQAATNFAEQTLGLKMRAKCFIQNESSRRMILACGYRETHRDKTYQYFER